MESARYVVVCNQCGERHFTDEVKCVNVEEDDFGRDVVYFVCPETGKQARSNVHVVGWS